MNILKILSFIALCALVVATQNVEAMDNHARKNAIDARIQRLSESLMRNKSISNVTQVRDQARIVAIEAQDIDMILAKRARDIARRADGLMAHQQIAPGNRQRNLAARNRELLQARFPEDMEMPDFAPLNLAD